MGNTFTTFSDAGGRLLETIYYSVYPSDLLILQGSSTYLLKYLGLDGKVVTKDQLKSALDTKLVDLGNECHRGNIKGERYQIDCTNLVKLGYASGILDTKAARADYFLGQRVFNGSDGKPLFSSMWAGYVDSMLANSSKEKASPFVFIDIGSGELKYFQVHPSGSDFSSDGQFSSQDGGEFVTLMEKALIKLREASVEVSETVADVAGFLRMGIDQKLPIHSAASASVRLLNNRYPSEMKVLLEKLTAEHMILIDILTPEMEAVYEWGAVRKALSQAGSLPNGFEGKVLVGNLAWGNGSTQGQNKTEVTIVPVGLKTVKKMISDGRCGRGITISGEKRKEKLSFASTKVLMAVVENLKVNIRNELPKGM